ncbi:MAG TPA: methyltransferase domain-containing protein [Acidobacteriaceae bacterium]
MAAVAPQPARFDRVARLYRAMEYLSFGPMLERCRFAHLPSLRQASRALILGDGDGRFTAKLLAANPHLHVDAVDASPEMLRLLRQRVARAGAAARLTTSCADARDFEPLADDYDLVVTHFFLDCLSPAESEELIARLEPHLAPGTVWLVSEFQVPESGRVHAWLARRVIRFLYAAFRVLTGLAVREIPPWRESLSSAEFTRGPSRSWLGGLLVSEVWDWQTTAARREGSHQGVPAFEEFASTPGSIPGIDPGPEPFPGPPQVPEPTPAPGPPPEPDPEPYPGPIPAPQPVTRGF